jgi:hypothetical protein
VSRWVRHKLGVVGYRDFVFPIRRLLAGSRLESSLKLGGGEDIVSGSVQGKGGCRLASRLMCGPSPRHWATWFSLHGVGVRDVGRIHMSNRRVRGLDYDSLVSAVDGSMILATSSWESVPSPSSRESSPSSKLKGGTRRSQ